MALTTYLDLCKHFREDVGISGDGPVSVLGQTGMMRKLCNWIVLADLEIQKENEDWNFLWREHTWDLEDGKADYPSPDSFGNWDRASFSFEFGTANYMPLTYYQWRDFRNKKLSFGQIPGDPLSVTERPDRTIYFDPIPEIPISGPQVRGEFWLAPTPMVANDSQSPIPEHFRYIIVTRAKWMYAKHMHDQGLFDISVAEYRAMLDTLESSQLPNRRTGTSEQEVMMVQRAE